MTKTIGIQEIYKEVQEIKKNMISKSELAAFLETIQIIHNSETMAQIKASEEDILAGKTKQIRSVKDLLLEYET